MVKVLLYPISLIYGLIVFIRNKLFDLNMLSSQEFDIPVISVGNINVGGTGKTPHIEYLVSVLKSNFKIATLSRGYKRKTKGFILANSQSTATEIGDEPLQIKNKFPSIDVAVDACRVNGINQLLNKNNNLNAILLDDAFQHRYVNPGISILLIDYNNPLSKDYLLPLGRLREPASQTKRASIIIVTKCPSELKPIERRIMEKDLGIFPYQNLYFTTFNYGKLIPIFSANPLIGDFDDSEIKKYSLLVVTGIANPDKMLSYLGRTQQKIEHLKYPDHYNFKQKDIANICNTFNGIENKNKIIITTEKDAMRLKDSVFKEMIINLPIYYLPIEINFLFEDSKKFNNQIISYVKTNKRDSIVYRK